MIVDLYAALLMGLAGATHCVAMCGGLANTVTLISPFENKQSQTAALLCYHLGRLCSYALMGAMLGGAFSSLAFWAANQQGLIVLRLLAAIMMIVMACYLAGWNAWLLKVEQLGKFGWRWLAPMQQPIRRLPLFPRGFFMGMLWGWLPCGLVYSALSWAAVSGQASQGALFMLLFGVGTLPALLLVNAVSHWLKKRRIRQINAILLMIYGIHTGYIALKQWPW